MIQQDFFISGFCVYFDTERKFIHNFRRQEESRICYVLDNDISSAVW